MRRTVLYISMSLDGCLARPDGDVSWLAGQDPDDPDPGTYPAFLSTVDTVAMGWRTKKYTAKASASAQKVTLPGVANCA